MVIATQNPIEHEGTYPLPESQLDRFLMRISVGYPSRQSELEILDTHGSDGTMAELHPVATVGQIEAMVESVKAVHVAPALKDYLVDLADATRRHPNVALGMSPRATLACSGRPGPEPRRPVVRMPSPTTSRRSPTPCLSHRLLLSSDAQLQGISAGKVVADILNTVPVPTGR